MQSTVKHPGGNIVYSNAPSYDHIERLLNLNTGSGDYVHSTGAKNAIINKYDTTGLKDDVRIVGYRASVFCQLGSYDVVSYRLVTGLTQGNSSYSSIGDLHRIPPLESDFEEHERTVEVFDRNDAEVIWMNEHKDKVMSGVDFGLRLYYDGALVWYAALEIFYQAPGLYVANTKASSVFVNTAKAGGFYLAGDKIL